MTESIGVIGAGAWGTALANVLAEKGHAVTLWAHEPEVVAAIRTTHENPLFLPGITLHSSLKPTATLTEVVRGMRYVVLVVPSQVMHDTALRMAPHLAASTIVINCSKGIDVDSGRLISEVLAETCPQHPSGNIAFLSGPSFAREVAERRLTAVVIASRDPRTAAAAQALFRTPYFLTFCHDDIVGLQVGGAVKNILAIATGISDGLHLGYNTRAALLTRGLYEMMKLGRAMGANPLTFGGLAGVGDLLLTCTGDLSRNRTVGLQLAQGKSLTEVLGRERTIAEGVGGAKAVRLLCERYNVHAPICRAVYQVLYEGKPCPQAVAELTAMELGQELGALLSTPKNS